MCIVFKMEEKVIMLLRLSKWFAYASLHVHTPNFHFNVKKLLECEILGKGIKVEKFEIERHLRLRY